VIARALVLAMVVSCSGPTLTVHSRTSPLRVDVTKQASRPELRFAAHALESGDVELVAKNVTDVRLTRVVHYGAMSTEYARGSSWVKLGEIPLGLFIFAFPPVWTMASDMRMGKNTSTTRYEGHGLLPLILLNPRRTAFHFHINIDLNARTDVFVDPPVVRDFRMSLPSPALTVAYRALDESERAIASGTATTDEFGRVVISTVSGAIALEIISEGTTTIVPIEVP
jgi:hypothetical protein